MRLQTCLMWLCCMVVAVPAGAVTQAEAERIARRYIAALPPADVTYEAINTVIGDLDADGKPEIVNTDQGSQFTATDFTDVVLKAGCKLSMDGRGAWRDNVFVERLWRTIKYEHVYKHVYASVADARTLIGRHIDWYNTQRPHSSLQDQTPVEAYRASLPKSALAA